MPRVVSGLARGRRLSTVEGCTTRPTADRVKEAIFSALAARMELRAAVVLELFAGSGQLGIEALSRGAARVVFVEHQRKAAECIRRNLEVCAFREQAEIVTADALSQSGRLAEAGVKFDLILADPPYAEAASVLRRLDELFGKVNFLNPGGILLLEYAKADAAEKGKWPLLCNLIELRSCQYGGTMVSFYKYKDGVD